MAGINGGSSSSSSQQVQLGSRAEENQLPFLKDLWGQAQGFLQGAGAQDVAQMKDWTRTGIASLLGFQNPQQIQQQMKYYGDQVGQQFRENILPQISGEAQSVGGFGNSRNQLAQGYAAAQMGKQIGNMGNQLYNDNQNRTMQAALAMPQAANAFGNMGWSPYLNLAGILGPMQQRNLGGYGSSSSSSWNAGAQVG